MGFPMEQAQIRFDNAFKGFAHKNATKERIDKTTEVPTT
jgi:hypothetical protein